ncbi:MAG: DUF2156 domain-containing protein [Christensenellaceae bacterium]|nr:DUF2156 domain-containing protein [Christensenellaceae bacterium]
MLQTKEITLALGERYKKLLGRNDTSYYSFTNIFYSRDCTHYQYVDLEEEGLCIICRPPEMAPMCMFPLGVKDLRSAVLKLHKELGVQRIIPLRPDMAEQLQAACGDFIELSERRNSFDYVYATQQMIELKGKAYHSKRNFITRFTNRFDYRYIPLTQENVRICQPMVDLWFEEHPDYESPMFNEKTAIEEIMNNFDALGLKGGAIEVDGRVVAFSIGENIAPDVAHILIEKADTTYPGAYTVINNEFLKNAWSHTTYVNREEDMGLEGLRKAKLSYHPDHFNVIYSADIKL